MGNKRGWFARKEPHLYRAYPVPFAWVFSELYYILNWLGFNVIHCDPKYGLILADKSENYSGYYEFHVRQTLHDVEVWVKSGMYTFIYSGDLWAMNNILMAYLDERLKYLIPMYTSSQLHEGDRNIPKPPNLSGYVTELEMPSPFRPAALALINGLIFFIPSLIGETSPTNVINSFYVASPFFIAGFLMLLKFYRTGAFICAFVGSALNILMGFMIGFIAYFLVFLALLAAMGAMYNHRFQDYFNRIQNLRKQESVQFE